MSANGSVVAIEAGIAAIAAPERTAANMSSNPVTVAPIGGRSPALLVERPERARHRVDALDPAHRLGEQVGDVQRSRAASGWSAATTAMRRSSNSGSQARPSSRNGSHTIARSASPERTPPDGSAKSTLRTDTATCGRSARERAQDPRGDVERGGGEQADGERARLARRCAPRGAQRVVHPGQQRRRRLEQRAARRGQLDAARRALEQARAHALLELADLRAQRRLREMQPLGRAGEVELLRDRDERAQMPELDVHASASRRRASA